MADYGFSINVSGKSIEQLKAIEAELQKLGVQASNTTSSLANSFSSAGNSIIGSLKGIAAAAGISFGVAGIVNFTKQVIEAGTTIENAQTGLTTLLKNSLAAQEVISNTLKDATTTPFAFEGLLAANKALISANVNAKSARQTVLDLANAIAATGGGDDELNRMVANLQQIKNVGQATAADIKQFGNAGINIFEVLKQATGKSTEEVQEMKVSYDLLAASLRKAAADGGIYANGLENMAKNTSVQISNLGDSVFQLSNNIFEDLKPAITDIISEMSNFIETMHGVWEWAVENKAIFQTLFTVVSKLIPIWVTYRGVMMAVSAITKVVAIENGILTLSMGSLTIMTDGATIATEGLAAALSTLGIGALVVGLGLAIEKFIDINNEIDKTVEGITNIKEITSANKSAQKETDRIMLAWSNWDKLNPSEQGKLFNMAKGQISTQSEQKNMVLEPQIKKNQQALDSLHNIREKKADQFLKGGMGGNYWGFYKGKEEYEGVKSALDSTKSLFQGTNKSIVQLADVVSQAAVKIQAYNKAAAEYNKTHKDKRQLISIGDRTETSKPVSTDLAIQSSTLSGASGGLGQAKQIHIRIDTVQKNYGVAESKNMADQAVQKIMESLNSFSDSQNSM